MVLPLKKRIVSHESVYNDFRIFSPEIGGWGVVKLLYPPRVPVVQKKGLAHSRRLIQFYEMHLES